ncbi:MAG: M48 family metallopeptidase [Syntrophorhabdaceae bacterium]
MGQASLFNDTDFLNYQVIRSKKRKRTMTLKIERNGGVIILVPFKTPKDEIGLFFKSKVPWINKKLSELQEIASRASDPKKYVTGEKFLYLGDEYPLELFHAEATKLVLAHGTFILGMNDHKKRGRDVFLKWYKERAREIFAERVIFYGKTLGIESNGIRITSARTRYGSCSWDDRLTFSYRLVMAPYPVIDYIVVHELAHVKVKNHSRTFWEYVESIMPDYRQRKNWLKENGHTLDI